VRRRATSRAEADLRAAMGSYHVLGQEQLSRQAVDWYFATLPGFAATIARHERESGRKPLSSTASDA